MKWRTHYSPIGLDIGSQQVKMAQLKAAGQQWTRYHVAVAALANAGEPQAPAADEQIVHCLRTKLAGGAFIGKKVIAALPGDEVDIRTITVPLQVEARELPHSIRQEVSTYLPYPLEEAVLDYCIGGEAEHDGTAQRRVLVVSTLRQHVEHRLALLQAAGLYCLAIEVLPLAMCRLLVQYQHLPTDSPLLVVDIGHAYSTALILWQGALIYSRTFAWGGELLTQAIMKDLKLPYDKAERLKQQYGIDPQASSLPTLTETQQRLNMQAIPGLLWEIVRPRLESFVEELERILSYWGARYRGTLVERLYLSGGGAALPQLDTYLQQRMALEVMIVASCCQPGVASDSELSPVFATAVGLALRG
jgi:type IV pilus assembly protein PilM